MPRSSRPAAAEGGIPDPATLPPPVLAIFRDSFGAAFGELFWVATPGAVLALVCVLLIREAPLRTSNVDPRHEVAPEATSELDPA